MSNEFFEHLARFIPGTKVKAEEANTKFDAIERGFDKLPTEQQLKSGNLNYAVATGAANAYEVDIPYPPLAYFDGLTLSFKANVANTGSSAINVNGLGNKSIVLPDGSPLGAGDIPANGVISLVYGAGAFQFQGTSISKTILATQKADEAAASAAAALVSKNAAQVSQDAALSSQTSAASSASAATASQTAAATSATNSANSAAAALASQNLSADWATKTTGTVSGGEYSAKKYALDALSYSTSAATSASNANTSATNAGSSASGAAASAAAALASKNAAATSESAAATSATNASNSAAAALVSKNAAEAAQANVAANAAAAAQSKTDAEYWAGQAELAAGGDILDDTQVLTTRAWSSSKTSAELAGKASTSHSHSSATTGAAGFMSAADKSKLDAIAIQATRTVIDDGVSGSGTVWSSQKVTTELAARQATIAAGTTAQFWRGDKTWQDFATAVRAAVLTGLSTASAVAIDATDSVLSALGKLQAQISLRALINSPTFTGTPSAPTAAGGTNTTQIATTAFVQAAVPAVAAAATKLQTARNINGVAFDGTANITVADSTKLPLSGGTLTGTLSTSASSIIIGTSGGATRGYLYNDTSGFGFLTNSGNWALRVEFGSTNVACFGSFTASGNITAYSDIRLKTNIEAIPDALNKVCSLRGVTYERIDTGERQTGVIAQEVQAVLPEAVMGEETLSVAYGNLVGLLIEAIKELKAEVDALKGGK